MFSLLVTRILILEFTERLAFYGVVFGFVTYMREILSVDPSTINMVMNGFYALCAVSSFGFGLLADMSLGSVHVLSLCGCIYAASLIGITTSNWYDNLNSFLCSIALMALGYGGIKVTTAPLVAAHVPEDSIDRVFRMYYWCINAGSLVGIIVCPELCWIAGPRKLSKDDHEPTCTAYWAATGFTACVSVLGLLVFVFTQHHHSSSSGGGRNGPVERMNIWHRVALALRRQSSAEQLPSEDALERDQLRHIFKLFLFLPLFWLLSNQQSSNYIVQATYMDRPNWLAPQALNVLNTITLLCVIPLTQFFFSFILKTEASPKIRIMAGFLLSALGLIVAGIIQVVMNSRGTFTEDGKYTLHPGMQRLSIWWQSPLYIIQSMSESLCAITVMELAYTLAPEDMKSICTSLLQLTSFGASMLGMLITPIATPEYYMYLFFGCAGAMVLEVLIFRYAYEEVEGGDVHQGFSPLFRPFASVSINDGGMSSSSNDGDEGGVGIQ